MFSFSCIVCVGSDPGSVSNHHAMCSKQATTYSCAAVVVCIPRPKVTGETSKMELLHNYWRFGKLGKAPNHIFLFTLFNFFCRRMDYHSGVAQWLACWPHNPKVHGSRPCSAMRLLNCHWLLPSHWSSLCDMQELKAHNPKVHGLRSCSALRLLNCHCFPLDQFV